MLGRGQVLAAGLRAVERGVGRVLHVVAPVAGNAATPADTVTPAYAIRATMLSRCLAPDVSVADGCGRNVTVPGTGRVPSGRGRAGYAAAAFLPAAFAR